MPEKYEVTVKIVVPSREEATEFVDSLAEYTGLFPSDSDPVIETESLSASVVQDRNYVISGGSKCPVCANHDLNSDDEERDGTYIAVNVYCNSCNHEWEDHYELQGILNLREMD
jgi:hypothetical protein